MRLIASDAAAAARAAEVLAGGGILIMPCDTIYGIVGVAPGSEARIRNLKGREEKSFLQLILDADWLPRFTEAKLPPWLAPYWPGPLTVIFPAGDGTVALRVPADPLLRQLLQQLDRPLYSTSVNSSGEPALWRIAEIRERFEPKVDLVVDAGDLADRVASTILDVTSHPFRVLRRGALELPAELLT
jgi:L-threonylcarbamoyladenylate synthase